MTNYINNDQTENEKRKYLSEIIKQAFDFGIDYIGLMQSNINGGQFPKEYDKAIKYIEDYIIENKRDSECVDCGRYIARSCKGVIPRLRKEINDSNRCGGYYKLEQ